MMTSKLSKSFNDGFLLTEKELRIIYTTMEQQIKQVASDITPSFELKFANGLVGGRPSLDAIFKEENGDGRAIHTLTIELLGKNQAIDTASILLKFASQPPDSINYLIAGNDETWITNTDIILEKRLSKVKKFSFNKLATQVTRVPFMGIYGTIANIGLELGLRGLVKSSLISDYTFAWGESLDALNRRLSRTKFITNVVLVGIVLAFIIGVLAGITANYFSALLKIGVGH